MHWFLKFEKSNSSLQYFDLYHIYYKDLYGHFKKVFFKSILKDTERRMYINFYIDRENKRQNLEYFYLMIILHF